MSLDAFRALIKLSVVIVLAIYKAAKVDGWQWTDLFAFLSSEEFKAQIGPTIQQMPNLSEDFKNFDGHKGFEIARIAVDIGEELYDEFTKKPA